MYARSPGKVSIGIYARKGRQIRSLKLFPHIRCPQRTSLTDDRSVHSTMQRSSVITTDQPEPVLEVCLRSIIQSIWKRNTGDWKSSQSSMSLSFSTRCSEVWKPKSQILFHSLPLRCMATRPGPNSQWVGVSWWERHAGHRWAPTNFYVWVNDKEEEPLRSGGAVCEGELKPEAPCAVLSQGHQKTLGLPSVHHAHPSQGRTLILFILWVYVYGQSYPRKI